MLQIYSQKIISLSGKSEWGTVSQQAIEEMPTGNVILVCFEGAQSTEHSNRQKKEFKIFEPAIEKAYFSNLLIISSGYIE